MISFRKNISSSFFQYSEESTFIPSPTSRIWKSSCTWKYFRKFKFSPDLEKLAANMAHDRKRASKQEMSEFCNRWWAILWKIFVVNLVDNLEVNFSDNFVDYFWENVKENLVGNFKVNFNDIFRNNLKEFKNRRTILGLILLTFFWDNFVNNCRNNFRKTFKTIS